MEETTTPLKLLSEELDFSIIGNEIYNLGILSIDSIALL